MPGWQQVHGGCREEIKKRIHGGRNILPGEYVVDIIHIASLMVFEKGAATLPD